MSTKKVQFSQNNRENSYTEKKAKQNHGVQCSRLMIQKTDTIFIGEKIVLKSFVKI